MRIERTRSGGFLGQATTWIEAGVKSPDERERFESTSTTWRELLVLLSAQKNKEINYILLSFCEKAQVTAQARASTVSSGLGISFKLRSIFTIFPI